MGHVGLFFRQKSNKVLFQKSSKVLFGTENFKCSTFGHLVDSLIIFVNVFNVKVKIEHKNIAETNINKGTAFVQCLQCIGYVAIMTCVMIAMGPVSCNTGQKPHPINKCVFLSSLKYRYCLF